MNKQNLIESKYIIFTLILFTFIFILLVPSDSEQIISIIPIFFTIPGIIILLKRTRIFSNKITSYYNHSLSVIYFLFFFIFLLLGNLNFLAIKYFYPSYKGDLLLTNIYTCLSFYAGILGYFIASNINNSSAYFTERLETNVKLLTILFFCLGTIGSILIINHYNGIPILKTNYIGAQRFIGDPDTRGDRLFTFLIFSGMLSFKQILNPENKIIKNFYKVIFLLSIIQLPLLAMRYPIVLTLAGCFFIFLLKRKFHKKYIIVVIIIFSVLVIFNKSVKDFREGSDLTLSNTFTKNTKELLLNEYIPFTFNEYGQLVHLMEIYNDDFKYGETLLNIPISFIPYFVLDLFDIKKSEIRENNSAYILQMLMHPNGEGTGIRSGIFGELYVNFSYLGFLFMIFLGFFLGFLEKKLNSPYLNDFQIVIYVYSFVVLLYSFIGQIDALGGEIFTIFLISILSKFFSKKFVIFNNKNQISIEVNV